MSTDTKKAKALDLAITQIDRQFGKGSIMKMGAEQISISDNVISTGCLSLDVALGVGGRGGARKADQPAPPAGHQAGWSSCRAHGGPGSYEAALLGPRKSCPATAAARKEEKQGACWQDKQGRLPLSDRERQQA